LRVIGSAARIALSLVEIFAALSLLGLQFLSESLNVAVLAIPKVLLALPISLGRVAQVVVLVHDQDSPAEQALPGVAS
jgi:hypothetical protein